MTELDQIWSQFLTEAALRARNDDSSEIADYLRVKAVNDAIRNEGVRWLFDAAIELAAELNRRSAAIEIERIDGHSFKRGSSNMAGHLIRLSQGVRCLSVEAGWTRTPSDGIMRRGALAAARIRHFGIKRSNADLSLAYAGDLPLWHIEDEDGRRTPFRIVDLHDHFRVFLDV